MMLKCENVVAVSFSERLGGPQGYNLLLATLKTSLCSTFLDGGVSYGPFTAQLIGVHLECGPFYQKLKICLFSTPRPGSTVNFSGDTKRELDNKDAVKCFHSGSTLDSVMRKMSLMDSFSHIHSTFKCGSGLRVDEVDHLGWKTTPTDWKYVIPTMSVILRCGGFSLEPELLPCNIYAKVPFKLDLVMLDKVSVPGAGMYLLKKTAAAEGIFNFTESNMPDLADIDAPTQLIKRLKGISKTIRRSTIKNVQKTINKSQTELEEEKRTQMVT